MNELIPTDTTLSPMEAWRVKHNILTYEFKTGHVAHVDGDDVKGKGGTKEDALLDWAAQKLVPCWREEQFLKMGGKDE